MLRSVTAGDNDKRKQQCRVQTGRSITTAVVSSQSEPSAYSFIVALPNATRELHGGSRGNLRLVDCGRSCNMIRTVEMEHM